MFKSEVLLHVAVLATVSLGGILLGMGQRDWFPTLLAVGGAALAYLITEVWRLFRLDQWFANLAAILVTAYALFGFGEGDRIYQLIVVANLLVYLQTILLFQAKTPRLYWQVLVLSLLQVVVAAVFNLGFEGGMLFVIYMICAGGTTMLLCLYQQTWNIRQKNRDAERSLLQRQVSQRDSRTIWFSPHPAAVFQVENRDPRVILQHLKHYLIFGLAAFAVALVLFFMVPRDSQVWRGPLNQKLGVTGVSKSVNLNFSGQITLSDNLVMRVTLHDASRNADVQLAQPPYMRGMPLGKLVLRNNVTSWEPQYQRVPTGRPPEPVVDYVAVANPDSTRPLMQTILLQSNNNDPLLYSSDPHYSLSSTAEEVAYVTGLGCLKRDAEATSATGFTYRLGTMVNADYSLLDYFPHGLYESERFIIDQDNRRGYYADFTELDQSRYPTVVTQAWEQSGRIDDRDVTDYEVARRLERYFLSSGEFNYTLNLGSFNRDRSLDPIEDFVRNHRSGHCEFFASALTVMLRSLDIPARLVVGYRGGEFNESGNYYEVMEKHAHAWVEAYIRPDQLPPGSPPTRSRLGQQHGIWLRLDPTPSTDFDETGLDTLSLARSFWDDYILGRSGEGATRLRQGYTNPGLNAIGNLLNIENWRQEFQRLRQNFSNPASPVWYLRILLPTMLLMYVFYKLRQRSKLTREERRRRAANSSMRQFLGKTVGWLSPKLGNWLTGQPTERCTVPFYEQFNQLMRRLNCTRDPHATPLEFVDHADSCMARISQSQELRPAMDLLTQYFYRVRFGNRVLNETEQQQVEQALQRLETVINETSSHRSSKPKA